MGYDNIEKVKSKVFKPCNNVVIHHITKVASKDKDGRRDFAHKEITYKSNIYIDKKYISNINLDFDSYLEVTDTSRDWTDDRAIKIGYIQMPILLRHLKKVIKWFSDEKYDDLYYLEDGRLRINADFLGLKEVIELGYKRGLIFSPTVIVDYDGTEYEGVAMIINNEKCGGKVTVDNLFTMYYLLEKIDLYQLGLTAMCYLQRPDFEDNPTILTNNNDNYQRSSTTSKIQKKDDKPKMLEGFFK